MVDSVDGAFGVIFADSFPREAALRDFGGGEKLVPPAAESMFFICPDDNDVGVDFLSYCKGRCDCAETVA